MLGSKQLIVLTATMLVLVSQGFATDDIDPYYQTKPAWDEAVQGPLPRWRMGGTPAPDPNQSLTPYSISLSGVADAPTSGLMASPPEYAPSDGVIFRYSTSAWSGVVTDCVAALTGDPAHDEIAYVVVSSTSQRASAQNQFAAAGADLSKVEFIIMPTNSIWLRDYGPHFVWQNGTKSIVDSHYYPGRPLDNFTPTLFADDYFIMPSYDIGLYYSGGNFQPGPNRQGFITSLVMQDNGGFGEDFIRELYNTYQGIDTLHIFPRLPSSVDGTGHIDMWLYLVDDDTAIVSEFLPGSNATAISVTNDAALYLQGLGFEVIRVPDHNGWHPYDSQCHFTYANAFRVNDRIFIPTYGEGSSVHLLRDAEALNAWGRAAPDAEIVPINCYDIIYAAGAIHCIVMQVPRYTPTVPASHVISPAGGELLVWNTQHELLWAATDDDSVESIDLYYSTNGGVTYDGTIALGESDDGHHTWTVPTIETNSAVVKVVAHDAASNTSEATGEGVCIVTDAMQHVYDFSSGAGTDKWAWGYQTQSWSVLQGVRHPTVLSAEISSLQSGAYSKIARPDASGTDYDPNRYRSPVPSYGRESAHVFEFVIEETPAEIVDIGLTWEGYGDDCLQVELYVWDYAAGDWCNGAGQYGENRFVDNQAANRDAPLQAHIRSDFANYLDAEGHLTMLVYAERSSQETMHDYVGVTVTFAGVNPPIPTLSAWGLVVMTLMVLSSGTLLFRMGNRASALCNPSG